jgi:2-polyprenyl-3-methyl-5-hydroxy-6-metoxy-1,4-benzoquinol methylase
MLQSAVLRKRTDVDLATNLAESIVPNGLLRSRREAPTSVFRNDEAAQRLHLLARVKWPSTRALLCRVGIHRGMHCLDLGCGSGEVAMQMARMVGPEGHAVGIDTDESVLARGRIQAARDRLRVEFRALDATGLADESVYDLVYARFLLAHMRDPEQVLERMVRATRPGGIIAIEDVDLPGHFCHPPCAAFERYVELYQGVVHECGGDPMIGIRLPGLLRAAGAEEVQVEVMQPTFCGGDGKLYAQTTLEQMRDAVVGAGLASHAEIDGIIAELDAFARDHRTLISTARVFQVWGRRLTVPCELLSRRRVAN